MLRCPQCSRVYQDGNQRFCTHDGARLRRIDGLPEKAAAQAVRRTPPGELLVESVIAPPMFDESRDEQMDLAESFKNFGLHDSNSINGKSASDNFANLHTTITTLPEIDNALVSKKDYSTALEKHPERLTAPKSAYPTKAKSQLDASVVAIGLLGAVLFLIALSLVGGYFLGFDEMNNFAANSVQTLVTPPAAAPLPDNYQNFQNSKTDLNDKLAERFVNFTIAFPNDWQKNEAAKSTAANNFLDVSKKSASGLPIEQLLVSWYESKGTMDADRDSFPGLILKLDSIYAKEIPQYQQQLENAVKINNLDGWEFRFTGQTAGKNGEPIKIWGRTIFLPVNQPNAPKGLVLTMLATSAAPDLTGAQDVGEKGELAQILKTLKVE